MQQTMTKTADTVYQYINSRLRYKTGPGEIAQESDEQPGLMADLLEYLMPALEDKIESELRRDECKSQARKKIRVDCAQRNTKEPAAEAFKALVEDDEDVITAEREFAKARIEYQRWDELKDALGSREKALQRRIELLKVGFASA